MKTKFEDVTNLAGLVIICLTLCYCANVASKAWVATVAIKAGQLNLKVK